MAQVKITSEDLEYFGKVEQKLYESQVEMTETMWALKSKESRLRRVLKHLEEAENKVTELERENRELKTKLSVARGRKIKELKGEG